MLKWSQKGAKIDDKSHENRIEYGLLFQSGFCAVFVRNFASKSHQKSMKIVLSLAREHDFLKIFVSETRAMFH